MSAPTSAAAAATSTTTSAPAAMPRAMHRGSMRPRTRRFSDPHEPRTGQATAMPGGIGQRLWIACHIGVAVQPGSYRIRAGEDTCRRVIVAGVVVVQPTRAVSALAGEGITGGHRPARPARLPIGGEELRRLHAAEVHLHRGAPEHIVQRVVPVGVVILGHDLPTEGE